MIVKFLTDGEYITTALDDLQDTTKQRMKEYEQITTMKILTCDIELMKFAGYYEYKHNVLMTIFIN